jgi:hypothetical protein
MNLDELKRRQETSFIAAQEREKKIALIKAAAGKVEQAFESARDEIASRIDEYLTQVGIKFTKRTTDFGIKFVFSDVDYSLELTDFGVSWINNRFYKGKVYESFEDSRHVREDLLKLSLEEIHSLTFMIRVSIKFKYLESLLIWRSNEDSGRVINAAISLLNGKSIKEFDRREFRLEEGSICFVATVVYGTEQAKEVQVLKNFRDEFLARYVFGRMFLKSYNKWSPYLAGAIENSPVAKIIAKTVVVRPAVLIAIAYYKFAHRRHNS